MKRPRPKSKRLAMLRVSIHEYKYRSPRHASGYRTGYLVRVTRDAGPERTPVILRKWTQKRPDDTLWQMEKLHAWALRLR